MRKIPFYQVDAFASRPLGGNPAAVLVLEEWISDADMLGIADENNIAITAFVRSGDNGWELRWFIPGMEVDLCGHGTLAAAHVLAAELGVAGDFVFLTQSGPLRVGRHVDGYALDLSAAHAEPVSELPPVIGEILGIAPIAGFRTARNLYVELPNEDLVRDFVPDLAKIATLYPSSFVITARGHDQDFVSRHFAPGSGIDEDWVTGSIHATLVPYWAHLLGKDKLTAFQCSRRGGFLSCELRGDTVRIVGEAVTYLKGEVILP